MTWRQRYRVRNYVQGSLWIWPVAALAVAVQMPRLIEWAARGTPASMRADPAAARDLLGILAASIFTCIIFAFSALLLAVQLASAQLTPRIIALVFRDPVTKVALTVFTFTFTFALAVQIRIGEAVPPLTAKIAAYSCLLSLGLFMVLIDHVGKFLRPSGALRAVACIGQRIIEDVYPRHLAESVPKPQERDPPLDGKPAFTVTSRGNGVILALDVAGLVAFADRYDCVVVMGPQIGDHVAAGDPLFRIFHDGRELPADVLGQSIAVGQERTFKQDPALAFRVIVDVACKALSPAINDPTTAVLAIDQLHHLLRNVGHRHLDESVVRNSSGRLRLVYRTPDWEDFVLLAMTEIRQFGGESIQVARRLRAMLENLLLTLPTERAAPLQRELQTLRHSAARAFPEPADRAMADVGDTQGVGGTPTESATVPS